MVGDHLARLTASYLEASPGVLVVPIRASFQDWRASSLPPAARVAIGQGAGPRKWRCGAAPCPRAAAELPPDHPGRRVIARHKAQVLDRWGELIAALGLEEPDGLPDRLDAHLQLSTERVEPERLAEGRPDGAEGVQRRCRVLEDRLDVATEAAMLTPQDVP
jgi:hypothetical protein